MAAVDDGLVDSPFGRVRPEILDILNGGQGAPAQQQPLPSSIVPSETPEAAPVAAPEALPTSIVPESMQPQEPEDPNSFGASVGRGVAGLKAAVGGTTEVAGHIFNSAVLKDAGEEIRTQSVDEQEAYGQPQYASVSDITDPFDMNQVGSYLKNQVGQMAPQLAVVGGGSLAAAKAASKLPGVAGLIGKGAAAAAGAFLTSFGLNTGNMQVELKQLDPQGNHPLTALAFGAGAGVLDSVGFGMMAKPLLKYVGPEQIYMHALAAGIPAKTALDGLKSVATGAAVGAATNTVTDTAQAVIAGETTDKPYTPEQLLARGVDNLFGGAIGGGAIRAGGEILDRVVQNATVPGSGVQPGQKVRSDKEDGVIRQALNATMNEATAPLERLASVSPEFESLIRDFRADMSGQKATGETVHERYEILSGKLHTDLDSVFRGKSKAEQAKILADLEDTNATAQNPDAMKVRSILNETWDLADNAGMNVGRVADYTPYTLDDAKIRKNRAAFEQDLANAGYQNPTQMVDEWLNQIDNPRDPYDVPKVDKLVQPNATQPQLLEIMNRFRMKGDPNTMRGKFAQGPGHPPKNSQLQDNRAFA